jgi:hypothetical protein
MCRLRLSRTCAGLILGAVGLRDGTVADGLALDAAVPSLVAVGTGCVARLIMIHAP